MTQEGLADVLGVSAEAVSKYERSLSYIRGDLEHRLAERLGWSAQEITDCRIDWDARRERPAGPYRALRGDDVPLVFGDWDRASREMFQLVAAEIDDQLSEAFSADESVWFPIIASFPAHGALVVGENDRLVGHWGLQFLRDADRDRFRARDFVETDLSSDRLKRPLLPGRYYGYCSLVIVARGHEAAVRPMLRSFVAFLEELSDRGVYLDAIGAAAISAEGRQLCEDLGLSRLGPHAFAPAVEMWELPGARIARSLFGQRSPTLRDRYQREFGAG